MDKIWLKHYPPGVPAEINPDTYTSIVDLFQRSCHEHADAAAFCHLGVTLTYKEVNRYSEQIAAYLQQVLGLKKGDRFAIMMPNTLQYPLMIFAALRAGLIVVNVNPLYTPDELVHQINDADARALMVIDLFANTVEKALPRMPYLKHVIVTQLEDLFPRIKAMLVRFVMKYIYKTIKPWQIPHTIHFASLLAESKRLTFSPIPIANRDIAFLQYTGGTTGVAKGAVLTHRNIIANILQAEAWFKPLWRDQKAIIITALPLYHIFSLMANCLIFFKLGGLNVLITNPKDMKSTLKQMRRFKFTVITGVNTLFNAFLKQPLFAKLDFSHLKLALGGGMAVQEAVAEKWRAVTGVPLHEGYGLTEASPCVAVTPITDHDFTGSIGMPLPSTDIEILADGELAVKGPQVMQGYWRNPTETAHVFNQDGWLLTGDMASIDEKGYLRILERKKDMILVSGFNVYPSEIEDVITKLPGVKEVAVIGVANEKSGEAPKAFIVKEDSALTETQIIAYCHEHLTAYKVPKTITFCESLPKTAVGKIKRQALK